MLCRSDLLLTGAVLAATALFAAPAEPLPQGGKNDPVEVLRKEARAGNADSAFSLANAYLFGTPTLPANPVLGVYWLRRAADGGNLDARYDLGMCLMKGWGIRPDRPAAWVQFNRAAGSGHPAALAAREMMRAEGVEPGRVDGAAVSAVRPDLKGASAELLKLAQSGNLYALGGLVKLRLVHPAELAPMTPELLKLLLPHENSDHAELLFALGLLLHERGESARSARSFERAVKAGHAESAVELGKACERGDGVPFDPKKAAELFRFASQKGVPAGEYHYGMMLLSGSGTAEDLQQALVLLKKASDKGVPDAVYQLGLLAEKGIGGDADPEKAFFFYDRAMQLGSLPGALAAARCYRDGFGVRPDPLKAALAWKKAAEGGSAEGRRLYALALFNGFGLPRDRQAAMQELRRAAEAGDAKAQQMLKR